MGFFFFLFSSFLAESLELLLLGLRGHQPTEAEPLFVYAIEAAAIASLVVLKDYYFDGLLGCQETARGTTINSVLKERSRSKAESAEGSKGRRLLQEAS